MYLSRVEIDLENRQKIKDLSHLGAFHNWVEQSFPNEISQKHRSRKLWRIDEISNKRYLLVVSEEKPDQKLFEKYGVEASSESREYSPYIESLHNGLKARFRVVLNPVHSIRDGSSEKRGRIVPHVTVDHQLKFLKDRSDKNGFSLEDGDFYITKRGYVPLKKKGKKDISVVKAEYEGILTITDVERFKEILVKGFGKKKAYGFGMMTVIPMIEK